MVCDHLLHNLAPKTNLQDSEFAPCKMRLTALFAVICIIILVKGAKTIQELHSEKKKKEVKKKLRKNVQLLNNS